MQAELNTALIEAADLCGNVKDIEPLLKSGADVNARGDGGETALMRAVSYFGNIKAVKPLIAAGADVNARDNNGETAMMYLAKQSIRSYDMDELQSSISQTREAIKLLLEAGADVNATDNDGGTALKNTLFQLGNLAAFQPLLEAGADVNAAAPDGQTALIYLSHNKLMLECGEERSRFIAQHCFGIEASEESGASIKEVEKELTAKLVKLLLDAGADVNATDKDGSTALHYATGSLYGNEHVIKPLLDAGANPNAADNYGKTALTWAQEHGLDGVAALLRAAGATEAT